MLGLLHAICNTSMRTTQPISHLRSLNPHVQDALEGVASQWAMPRQAGGRALTAAASAPAKGRKFRRSSEEKALCGVSAFAFQVRELLGLVHTRRTPRGFAARFGLTEWFALVRRSMLSWSTSPGQFLAARC